MKKVLPVILLLLHSFFLFAQTPDFVRDSLDTYIQQGMKDWQVPGLAIVIVKDGKIAWMKGYGVSDLVSRTAVDENTLFMIASNTKLFTSTALSQLAYDKKISLDDKFTKYYPSFKLYDPVTTEQVTVKDLLSHRIGTKTFQGDFTFWNSHLSRNEIMNKMRLMKPVGLFRQDYGYCNSCVMAAGQVIPKVTGMGWQTYIRDSILRPLQMNATLTSIKELPAGTQLSKAYTTSFTGTLKQVPWDQWDNLGPAASLISNVSDLAHWLTFQLDSGRFQGRQIMPFDVLQKTRDINIMLTSRKSAALPTHMIGYGLGLFVADYNGRQVYAHSGGAAGMVSVVSFVPEERLGIAILTNNDNQNFFGALRVQILDAYLGVAWHNRSQQYLKDFSKEMEDTLHTIHGWQQRVKGATPEQPLSAYAGHYTNPLYGSIDIRQEQDHLIVTFNGHDQLVAKMDYMDNGEWLLQYENIEYGIFATRFSIEKGKVISLLTRQSDFVEIDPYVFTRQ